MILENIVFDQQELAPNQFQKILDKIASSLNIQDYKDVEITDDDVVIRFGESNLPSERNVVHIGGKFYNKERQARMLKGTVPTITTYSNYVDELGDKFLAKKKAGQRQEGQMDGVKPEDSTDYVFQPKVKIVKEFRVIVFYMNGKYYVSGVYEKTGSNVSVRSLGEAKAKPVAEMAKSATKKLKYGFAGVDIAIVHSSDSVHVTESVLGKLAQISMRELGNAKDVQDALEQHYPVVLEVNSFPSIANPAIAQDLLDAIQSKAR